MKITENTRIAELIKANPGSVEAIASLAKPFEKLRIPLLRKIMAPRVTIGEAAKMGGVALTDFSKALAPLGFEWEQTVPASHGKAGQQKPAWLQNRNEKRITVYDVRPIIDNGNDPLKQILGQFKKLGAGEILCVVNTFIPTPLIHLLKQEKAEDSFVEQVGEGEFHTYFLKKESKTATAHTGDEKLLMESEESFAELVAGFSPSAIRTIDVRPLEMPGPMELILEELDRLPQREALYVHHKRVPVYLLEELANKNFRIHIYNRAEGDVKVLIYQRK